MHRHGFNVKLRSFITFWARVRFPPREEEDAMLRQRARSRWSPHPPFPLVFFWFLLFFGFTLVTLSSLGNRKDLAFTRMSSTFLTTLPASHCFFLWWTPLEWKKGVRLGVYVIKREWSFSVLSLELLLPYQHAMTNRIPVFRMTSFSM